MDSLQSVFSLLNFVPYRCVFSLEHLTKTHNVLMSLLDSIMEQEKYFRKNLFSSTAPRLASPIIEKNCADTAVIVSPKEILRVSWKQHPNLIRVLYLGVVGFE